MRGVEECRSAMDSCCSSAVTTDSRGQNHKLQHTQREDNKYRC
jgi:hypothetical protein